ncbi:MAG TPA: MazG-like family protein [Syntrophomonadaceae bacterium]|nr:MazG-like family protein [Syntrophomonadaceae bacterium]HQE23720.1 MazG-like family protein [Syntrophomonadaceae bacterium]
MCNLASKNREIDVAKNLKIIEWLKAELVDSVGALFKALLKTGNDAAADALAAIIIVAYLLGKRVGVSFHTVDTKVKAQLLANINNGHEVERWYGDLSDLLHYIENQKR